MDKHTSSRLIPAIGFAQAGLLIFLFSLAGKIEAQWNANPAFATPFAVENGDQRFPRATPDGSGGIIAAWNDERVQDDLYAHRKNGNGENVWAANGVPVSTYPVGGVAIWNIIPDGTGGAFLGWHEHRGTFIDVYVQKLNSSGVPQWSSNGVLATGATNNQYSPIMIPDGTGGVIVTWEDWRGGGTNYRDIYVQRFDAAGVAQWNPDGVEVCTETGRQNYPVLTTDGAGGAIITWEDGRNAAGSTGYDIYAQRVNSNGVPQWATNGVLICDAVDVDLEPQIVSDTAGGAIIIWESYRSGNSRVFAQRLNGSGTAQWAANGIPMLTVYSGAQYDPRITADGSGGAIATWYDYRITNIDIYAQKINSSGTVQWGTGGVGVCTQPANQEFPSVCPDGSGGAVIAWQDGRGGTGNADIYAQKVDSAGGAQWTANGVALCTAAGNQNRPLIGTDGSGGGIAVWNDLRGANYDIYAAKVDSSGSLSVVGDWAIY